MKRSLLSERAGIENKFKNRIISLFSNQIIKVILFGSRAKGVPKPGSDYDFLIVLKEKDRKIVDEIYSVVMDFLIEYGVDISLKIYNEKDFRQWTSIPTPFMTSILKTGKELWSQKPEI